MTTNEITTTTDRATDAEWADTLEAHDIDTALGRIHVRVGGKSRAIVGAARAAFAGPTARAERPEFLAYLDLPLRDDPKSVAWALRSILIGRRDEHRLLNTITETPVLVIAGEEDSQFPVHAVRRMAEAIPTARFEVVLHTGHLAARENPEAVNALVESFLRDVCPVGGRQER